MMDNYILHGHTPVRAPDILTWARWYETADRRVAETWVDTNVRVSTVFLGIDHAFLPGEVPVLFETMIFGGPHDQEEWRYATWEEATEGHLHAVEHCLLPVCEED